MQAQFPVKCRGRVWTSQFQSLAATLTPSPSISVHLHPMSSFWGWKHFRRASKTVCCLSHRFFSCQSFFRNATKQTHTTRSYNDSWPFKIRMSLWIHYEFIMNSLWIHYEFIMNYVWIHSNDFTSGIPQARLHFFVLLLHAKNGARLWCWSLEISWNAAWRHRNHSTNSTSDLVFFLRILTVLGVEVVEEESEFSDYMKEICEKVTPGPKTVKAVHTHRIDLYWFAFFANHSNQPADCSSAFYLLATFLFSLSMLSLYVSFCLYV